MQNREDFVNVFEDCTRALPEAKKRRRPTLIEVPAQECIGKKSTTCTQFPLLQESGDDHASDTGKGKLAGVQGRTAARRALGGQRGRGGRGGRVGRGREGDAAGGLDDGAGAVARGHGGVDALERHRLGQVRRVGAGRRDGRLADAGDGRQAGRGAGVGHGESREDGDEDGGETHRGYWCWCSWFG